MIRLVSSAVLAMSVLFAAGCSSGGGGQATQLSVAPDALRIAARDLSFSTDSLSGPAGRPFQIAFENQEGAAHNVAIYKDSTAAEKVFGSDPFGGPASVAYDVPALERGTYFFRCDLHPDMKGELTIG
jgi:plastocyanin